MTALDLCAQQGVDVYFFDGRNSEKKAFYNPGMKLIALDAYLEPSEKEKILYHELGHRNHTASQYELHRELCELQADRNMIHHLLKDELATLDDHRDFNYVHFMEKYKLKTMTDEVMVKEEFDNLANII